MTQMKTMSKNANNFGPKRTSTGKYAAIQFFRTALCNDFMYGRCPRGEKCTFAHGEEHLASRPTLSKTKMCPHRNCFQRNCGYAHSRKELVSTGSFWKTEMCRFGQLCKIKNTCRFAHEEVELRTKTHNGDSSPPAEMVEQMQRTAKATFSESSGSDARKTKTRNNKTEDESPLRFNFTVTKSQEEDEEDAASADFDVRSVGELRNLFLDRDSEFEGDVSLLSATKNTYRLPSSYSVDVDQGEIMERVSSYYPSSVQWWSITEHDLAAAMPTHYEE